MKVHITKTQTHKVRKMRTIGSDSTRSAQAKKRAIERRRQRNFR